MGFLIGAGGNVTVPASDFLPSGKGFSLGSRADGADGKTWAYARAGEAIAQYDAVHITAAGAAMKLTTALGVVAGQFGVAQIGVASGESAWFLVGGSGRVNVAAACEKNVRLYTSGTAGVLDDATASNLVEVAGVTLIASAGASATNAAVFIINPTFTEPSLSTT